MRRTALLFCVLICAGLLTAAAPARALYIGAGIGNTFFSSNFNDAFDQAQKISENSTAWKIFGGFRSEGFWNLEGGYRDFGKVTSTVDGDAFESKTKGWDVEALGRFRVAIVDVFGKAGVMFWTAESSVGDIAGENDGQDFLWGIGAGVHLGGIGVRAEWERLEVGGDDSLSMVSLSATLGF